MIYVNQVYYTVDGMTPSNKWDVVKNLEIYFAPLAVSINQEFHDFMKEFFFRDETEGCKAVAGDKKASETIKAKVILTYLRCLRILNYSTK